MIVQVLIFWSSLHTHLVKSGPQHQDQEVCLGSAFVTSVKSQALSKPYSILTVSQVINMHLNFKKDFSRRGLYRLVHLRNGVKCSWEQNYVLKLEFIHWSSCQAGVRGPLFLLHRSHEKELEVAAGTILQSRTNIKRQQARGWGQAARAVGLGAPTQPRGSTSLSFGLY